MNREEMLKLRDYHDNHDSSAEMQDGHWGTDTTADPNVSITVSLPKSVLDKLRGNAREQGVTVYALAATVLKEYIATDDARRRLVADELLALGQEMELGPRQDS